MIPRMKLYSSAASSVLTAAIILAYLFDVTSGLTCHCLNSSPCDQSNGFCPSGCDKGWYGPGCQVGNLALGKNANQSSIYNDAGHLNSAGLAVDGLFPSIGDTSTTSCTHTLPKSGTGYVNNAWWYVQLSQSDVFVLTNITIINRQGIHGGRLGNFSILYTNDSTDPSSPAAWTLCAYEANNLSGILNRNYTCQGLAVGRKVAVYLNADPSQAMNDNILTLCEVYVYGYELISCRDGYYGPGCLLRKYNSSVCLNTPNTTRGDFDGCRFLVCPDSGFWPPDCWITMPSFANVSWKADAVCNQIKVSAQSLSSNSDLNATFIVVNINASGSPSTSIQQSFAYSQSGYFSVSIPATANQTYYVWLTPQTCSQNIGCPSGPAELCSANAQCLLGISSHIQVVQTGINRQYNILQNGSCIFANVIVINPTCELPVSLSVSCNKSFALSQQYTNSTAILCGLSEGMNYSCTVSALLSNNITEQLAANVFIPYTSTSTTRITCHCSNGSLCDLSNGFCPSGCKKGWYGPGCQVGNLALGKTAIQSSTYSEAGVRSTASLAVDGLFPGIDNTTAMSCSHTSAKDRDQPAWPNAWWYVQLSQSQAFVLRNITIINRQGLFAGRLGNFSILYTNDSAEPPSPVTWTLCAYEANNLSGILSRNYSCQGLAIGRKVAVYLNTDPNQLGNDNILTICEVYVYGYALIACPMGYTGPGCLLQACDSALCSSNSTRCDDFGGCTFNVCPNKARLPPDCWITLPDLSNSSVQVSATCDSVSVSAQLPTSKSNYPATDLIVNVSSPVSSQAKIVNLTSSSNIVEVNFAADPGQSYTFSITPLSCNISGSHCVSGQGAIATTVETGKRIYWFSHNNSCLFVTVNSSAAGCESPTALSIRCDATTITDGSLTTNSSDVLCGLARGVTYNCSVVAAILEISETANALISDEAPPSDSSPTVPLPGNTGNIIGYCVGGALLVILIASVVVFIRRRKTCPYTKAQEASSAITLPPYPASNRTVSFDLIQHDDQTYGNVAGMTLTEFRQYVADEVSIARRFEEIQANETHPCSEGKEPVNKGKNRFQNILPYDFNRVTLSTPGQDYINASYIDGPAAPKQYIATQGPSAKTIGDFWKMLWQERCPVIVMLTDYVEHAKKKCEKYFPVVCSAESSIEVSVRSVAKYDTYMATTLDIQHGGETREVRHYHFLSWPDQSVPQHCAELSLFYSKIRRSLKGLCQGSGPVVVHCSAGVGRTGSYIAFDYLQQRFQSQGCVDVDNCVLKLRDQRMKMVQTKEQYVFLHKAVLYGMRTLKFVFEASQLPSFFLKSSGSAAEGHPFSQEWQELQACTQLLNESNYASARLPENKAKNRSSLILADDSRRPILAGESGTTQGYINAVYCNGCYYNRGFIATQLPLPGTVADFWQMVYECQPSCVVLLHNLPPDKDCPHYWPEPGLSMTAGSLVVTSNGGWTDTDDVRVPVLGITLTLLSKLEVESVSTKLLMTSLWNSSAAELPQGTQELLGVAQALRIYCQDAPKRPVVVQCRDGASQCGLFIAAVNALHRLMETDQVCVFHTVDLLRASRREFVKSEAQYQFIYQVLQSYSEAATIYANA